MLKIILEAREGRKFNKFFIKRHKISPIEMICSRNFRFSHKQSNKWRAFRLPSCSKWAQDPTRAKRAALELAEIHFDLTHISLSSNRLTFPLQVWDPSESLSRCTNLKWISKVRRETRIEPPISCNTCFSLFTQVTCNFLVSRLSSQRSSRDSSFTISASVCCLLCLPPKSTG